MTAALLMLATLLVYFAALLLLAMRNRHKADNSTFFRANNNSPWWMVGFGMIGASISGVSFISVPGWVAETGMTYLQMCLGFFFGYLAVAFVLLPLYYRLQLTSIYSWLGLRYGTGAHRTGASFFLISKLTGAAARLYLVCLVLQEFVFGPLGIPFEISAAVLLLLIWLYTNMSGVHTIVRTDVVQTACLLLALGWMVCIALGHLEIGALDALQQLCASEMSKVFEWEASDPQAFWRQFLSGAFIVVAMTGLDQDMMQKNLTCRTLRDAQKEMCAYGACFLPVNALFLFLGFLLYSICQTEGITPASGDSLLPSLVASGALGSLVVVPFSIGIVAAAFSSADSALTALTTSCCIDLLGIESKGWDKEKAVRVRRLIHIIIIGSCLLFVLLFRHLNDSNILNTIYVMASYTYGPLLGLFAFGMFSKRSVKTWAIPCIAIAAPLICRWLDVCAPRLWGFSFGYELLLLNGALTTLGLFLFSKKFKAASLQ